MHTLHWIAVEADSIEEAEQEVLHTLLNEGGSWYDWFDNDIAGRWANEHKTLQGAEIATGLELVKQWQKEEVEQTLKYADIGGFESAVSNFIEGGEENSNSYDFYYIKKLAEMFGGDWNCDTHFFDLVEGTARLNNVYQRLLEAPDKQFLVPIDFHF